MKFISVRELRNRPGVVWEELQGEDLVLTANGKPVGILLGVANEDIEDTIESVRRARALQAVSKMRRRAAATGRWQSRPNMTRFWRPDKISSTTLFASVSPEEKFTATAYPRAAASRAIAAPIPRLAPVTIKAPSCWLLVMDR